MFIKSSDLASIVRSRLAESKKPITVFWIMIERERESYRKELLGSILDREPIIPLILREALFDNPNAILDDFVNLLNSNRGCFYENYDSINGEEKIAVLIISRCELSIPQVASPVELPEWFPINGGSVEYVTIEDLTWTAELPLNSEEAVVHEMCLCLYHLEKVLLDRLETVYSKDKNACNAFYSVIKRESVNDFNEFLLKAKESHAEIQNPSAFRPSIREGKSLISRLWAIGYISGADKLTKPSKALKNALNIEEKVIEKYQESILAVLGRGSSREASVYTRFAKNLIITVFNTCQFVTAAAHADSYPRYPVALIKSISFDLRKSLTSSTDILQMLFM